MQRNGRSCRRKSSKETEENGTVNRIWQEKSRA
jgi:hypothetical protein